MGLFDKFKKPSQPERLHFAGLLFCPERDPKRALDQVEELFHMERSGDTNNLTLRNGDMEIVLAAFGSEDEGERGEYAKKQLQGAAGYVYQVKTDHVDIKRNLFYHLRQCGSVMQVVYAFDSTGPKEEKEKEQQVRAPIYNIVEKLQGVVTFGDGLSMLDSRGRLILDKDGRSQLDYYMPAERPVPADWAKDAPLESLERRDRSMALLREKHIYVTPWLPLLWEKAEDPGRTVEEVCGRAAALLVLALYSECRVGDHLSYEEGRKFVDPIIAGYGAEKFFSPEEKKYLDDPDSTEQTQIQFAWQYENLWVMEWALGLTDDLFWPTRICDVPGSVRLLKDYQTMETLLAAAKLRDRSELLDQADLIYRLRWACEDARVMGMPAPAGIDSGVALERHRSLFWLAGCDDMCPWDEVDLST